jgi:hypothetical protein
VGTVGFRVGRHEKFRAIRAAELGRKRRWRSATAVVHGFPLILS